MSSELDLIINERLSGEQADQRVANFLSASGMIETGAAIPSQGIQCDSNSYSIIFQQSDADVIVLNGEKLNPVHTMESLYSDSRAEEQAKQLLPEIISGANC